MCVGIRIEAEAITAIVYLPPDTPLQAPEGDLAERAVRQIERYRDDPDTAFDLPMCATGTRFQRDVWRQISAIPRGRTRTYGELARRVGGEARAVGQACGDNPFPIVVPCHRVVAADGLGGFSHHVDGYLMDAKMWLLKHEGNLQMYETGSLWPEAT
ncbi:MAG: methylated-DNA--[protein]-cysteine S-methyltransferase [Betaproteobacteria bacterium]